MITELLFLSRDAVHMHIGFLCLVFMLCFSKKHLTSFSIIIPGLILSILMEMMDFRDDFALGRKLNIAACIHDLVNTNFIPLCLVVLAKVKMSKVYPRP